MHIVNVIPQTGGNPVPDLCCPICLELYHEPVRWPVAKAIDCCGSTFCRACVETCLATSLRCPICRTNATHTDVTMLPVDDELAAKCVASHPILAAERAAIAAKLASAHTIALYPLKRMYDLRPKKTIELHLKEPHHLLMLARAYAEGGQFGLLFGEEREGTAGRIATLTEEPWKRTWMRKKALTIMEACSKVGFERHTLGSAKVKVTIGPLFRVHRVQHDTATEPQLTAITPRTKRMPIRWLRACEEATVLTGKVILEDKS